MSECLGILGVCVVGLASWAIVILAIGAIWLGWM